MQRVLGVFFYSTLLHSEVVLSWFSKLGRISKIYCIFLLNCIWICILNCIHWKPSSFFPFCSAECVRARAFEFLLNLYLIGISNCVLNCILNCNLNCISNCILNCISNCMHWKPPGFLPLSTGGCGMQQRIHLEAADLLLFLLLLLLQLIRRNNCIFSAANNRQLATLQLCIFYQTVVHLLVKFMGFLTIYRSFVAFWIFFSIFKPFKDCVVLVVCEKKTYFQQFIDILQSSCLMHILSSNRWSSTIYLPIKW